MSRKHRSGTSTGFVVLLADDDEEYREATHRLLESEGHVVISVDSGRAALDVLRQRPVDLLLLDYYMPNMTGEDVVAELRRFDSVVQVVLQTGYANEQPPREMLRRLDIQGYYDKGEGPDKLLLWTDVGLKASRAVGRLERSRTGLREILDGTPALHRIQPLPDLLEDIFAGHDHRVSPHQSCPGRVSPQIQGADI